MPQTIIVNNNISYPGHCREVVIDQKEVLNWSARYSSIVQLDDQTSWSFERSTSGDNGKALLGGKTLNNTIIIQTLVSATSSHFGYDCY